MSRKQHTEDRARPGRTKCGRPMPADHDDWSGLDSCAACSAKLARERDARIEAAVRANLDKREAGLDVEKLAPGLTAIAVVRERRFSVDRSFRVVTWKAVMTPSPDVR